MTSSQNREIFVEKLSTELISSVPPEVLNLVLDKLISKRLKDAFDTLKENTQAKPKSMLRLGALHIAIHVNEVSPCFADRKNCLRTYARIEGQFIEDNFTIP